MAHDGCEGVSLPVVSSLKRDNITDIEINVSDAAITALKSSMKGDEGTHVLVVSAQDGGCSGYMYDMAIVEEPKDQAYQRVEVSGMAILVHNRDSALLNGIMIDFKDSLMGGGFQIENPNADRSCGCGQSFG
ncbi:MAG: iron-sulfur cluster assembly accessory protein [Euryarchaeota archaeon]|jgi:iron-sulfur cluster assembly protein|nr:iron-sulfur cluster assembly accessory protein [Euryarchaeota archaeon]MBC95244.1 iron-sulfur cluster assembly accessory protein [Euryarchaeota archaeon]|tara:strand:+ start:1644 stop:2039 length:396 start_codon:yes stop_codon:yes gene_type:complete